MPPSGGFTPFTIQRIIHLKRQSDGSSAMQPIMEIAFEDSAPSRPEHQPCRMPIMSANFYPFTVFCWVLSVAVVGFVVGGFCVDALQGYTDLLRTLAAG